MTAVRPIRRRRYASGPIIVACTTIADVPSQRERRGWTGRRVGGPADAVRSGGRLAQDLVELGPVAHAHHRAAQPLHVVAVVGDDLADGPAPVAPEGEDAAAG